MASDQQPLTLMNIPLEVRHQIFEYVALRDVKPEKLLRYWFERQEVKDKTAELAAQNPNVDALRVVYDGDRFEHEQQDSDDDEEEEGEEDSDQDSDDEEDSEEDGDEDGDEEDDDEEEEEEEDDDEEDGVEEQDREMTEDDSTVVPTASATTVPANAQEATATATTSSQPTTQAQQDPAVAAQTTGYTFADQSTTAAPVTTSNAPQTQSQDSAEAEDADADMDDDDEEEEDLDAEDGAADEEDAQMDEGEGGEDEGGDEEAGSDSDQEMADEDGDEHTAAGATLAPPAPVISAHRKWRHIPQFMRITHCPPPVELLLTSKQLNAEAKSWFYDVAVLHVEATGSFAHTSFFEEAFSQITEAAFSPMEDIRKAEVTFVWDTAWLRSDRADCAAAIFPALLRQRAVFVTGILAQAPNLSEVTIHWHDSAKDEEAVELMNDVLMGLLGLDAEVKIEPHYTTADAKPYRKSIAGKQRVEFQRIVNNGLDRLF